MGGRTKTRVLCLCHLCRVCRCVCTNPVPPPCHRVAVVYPHSEHTFIDSNYCCLLSLLFPTNLGTVLDLSEDNVLGLLAACRQEIGTMFGYTDENRGVGITGGVDYVDMDGPTIILRLKGRFWHERKTVLARVGSYLKGRDSGNCGCCD